MRKLEAPTFELKLLSSCLLYTSQVLPDEMLPFHETFPHIHCHTVLSEDYAYHFGTDLMAAAPS